MYHNNRWHSTNNMQAYTRNVEITETRSLIIQIKFLVSDFFLLLRLYNPFEKVNYAKKFFVRFLIERMVINSYSKTAGFRDKVEYWLTYLNKGSHDFTALIPTQYFFLIYAYQPSGVYILRRPEETIYFTSSLTFVHIVRTKLSHL